MAYNYDKNDRIRPATGAGFGRGERFGETPGDATDSYSKSFLTTAAAAMPMEHGDHHRILIVDDHDDTGRALKRLLKRRGYDAEYVTSGHDAVEAIRHGEPPTLVILDVMMPDMSGLETLQEMRRTDEFDNTPVVMYSASEDPATMQQAFRLGARDYILKGSDWDEMMRRIDTAALPA